jgi:dCTP deaminase
MILTDKTINDEITEGNIVIEPFNPENLGTNSYDLTLSNTLVLYTERVLDV